MKNQEGSALDTLHALFWLARAGINVSAFLIICRYWLDAFNIASFLVGTLVLWVLFSLNRLGTPPWENDRAA